MASNVVQDFTSFLAGLLFADDGVISFTSCIDIVYDIQCFDSVG